MSTTATESCFRCGLPIDGMCTVDHAGRWHMECYRKAHPFVPKQTFGEVLNNLDDQVTVRELLHIWVPDDTKRLIIIEFNSRMQAKDRQ